MRIFEHESALWAPELIDAEVGSALRRVVRGGRKSTDRAGEALEELRRLPIHRISHERLAPFAWLLRDNVSFYDGLYVALAQLLDEPLLTFDARLARAGVDAEIEVLRSGVEALGGELLGAAAPELDLHEDVVAVALEGVEGDQGEAALGDLFLVDGLARRARRWRRRRRGPAAGPRPG